MFALYCVRQGWSEWRFAKTVGLARLLVGRILEEANTKHPAANDRMPWEISGDELRDRVMWESVPPNEQVRDGSYKLVIDATYTRADAHLFEICHVWGYADPEWSPLVLRLSHLCDGIGRPKGPGTPVESFEPEDECGRAADFVHEFLYLQHGHQSGTQKNWGRMGYTNAALLWPLHLEHLLGKIGFMPAPRGRIGEIPTGQESERP